MQMTASWYQRFPARIPHEPRDLYKECYRDLYHLYKEPLSEETFLEGSQYTQSEMGEALFKEIAATRNLTSLDLILCVFYVPEFDSIHSSCAAYLTHQFAVECPFFDISDAGTLGPFIALKLAKEYGKERPQRIMIMGLEQTSVPRNLARHDLIPIHDEAAALFLESGPLNPSSCYGIHSVEMVSETQVYQHFDVVKKIQSLIADHPIEDVLCLMSQDLFSYKKLNYAMAKGLIPLQKENFKFLPARVGTVKVLEALAELQHSTSKQSCVIVIDEDIASLNLGILCLKKS